MKVLFQLMFATILFLSLYLSLSPAVQTVPMLFSDKLVHVISYFVLMLTFDFSLKSGELILLKAVFVFLYSCAIEFAQGFVPGREVSLLDISANAAGVIAFMMCVPILKRFNTYRILRITE